MVLGEPAHMATIVLHNRSQRVTMFGAISSPLPATQGPTGIYRRRHVVSFISELSARCC